MQHQTEWCGDVGRQEDRLAGKLQARGIFTYVRPELPFDEAPQIGTFPDRIDKQLLRIGKRGHATVQLLDELRDAGTRLSRLVHHPLYDGQQILDAVREFRNEEVLSLLQRLAFRDVARAFEHEAMVPNHDEFKVAFDDQSTAILGNMVHLALPGAAFQQLLAQLSKGTVRHRGFQQLVFFPADRLIAAVTVELLAAPIPFEYPVIDIPHEKRGARDFHELRNVFQPRFADAQRVLHAPPPGRIRECRDNSLDLVVDRPVRQQTQQVPRAVAAPDLALDG